MSSCLSIQCCNCVQAASELCDSSSKIGDSLCHALQGLARPHGIAAYDLQSEPASAMLIMHMDGDFERGLKQISMRLEMIAWEHAPAICKAHCLASFHEHFSRIPVRAQKSEKIYNVCCRIE